MEALDSPEKVSQNVERGEEDESINEIKSNKEIECKKNDILHQNNASLELQKQKPTINNNSQDEKYREQQTKESNDMTFSKQERQPSVSPSPQNYNLTIQKQDIFHNPMDEVNFHKNDMKEAQDTEHNHECNTEDKLSQLKCDEVNAEMLTNTLPNSEFSRNSPAAQFDDASSDVHDEKLTENFPLKQYISTENEETKTPSDTENESEDDDTALRIYSPKINGNHKEVLDSTGDSVGPEDNTGEGDHSMETDKFEQTNDSFHIKQSEEHQESKDMLAEENPIHNKTAISSDQINEIDPAMNTSNGSRCQTPDSICSSSTILSSSSEHLVIDQPTDEEKVSPLRLKLKRKRNGNAKKQIIKSLLNTKKEALAITSNTDEIQNDPDQKKFEFPKKQDEIDPSLNTSPLNETNDMNEKHVGTYNLRQDSSVSEAFESKTKAIDLPCDCNKTKNVDAHLRTCPSYKAELVPSNYYKCTSCGTYHESWNFFLHIREKHDRFLCLYCIKFFPTAEKLSLHLEIKHDLEQTHFNSEESFESTAASYDGHAVETRFLLCCTCQHIFGERTPFSEHACSEYMKSCTFCGQKGRHSNKCKAHPFVKRRNKKKVKEKQSSPPPTAEVLSNIPEEVSIQNKPITENVTTHNEDSNSSSNMVIDESCTTNHSISGTINKFNATEEANDQQISESQEKPSAIVPIIEPENESINLLKFKLRVPKEFQKPVDAAMSSSESDDAVFEEDIPDESKQQNTSDSLLSGQEMQNGILENSQSDQLSHTDSNQSTGSANKETQSKIEECDDESIEDENTNPHITRILQEIEQTKLDIKRTKETINHSQPYKSHNFKNLEFSTAENCEVGSSDCIKTAEGSPKRNWTPTPPASPKVVENDNLKINDTSMDLEMNEDSNVENSEGNKTSENSALQILPKMVASIENDPMENEKNVDEKNNNNNDEPSVHNIVDQAKEENLDSQLQNDSENQQLPPSDGIEVANEDCLLIELQLDRPLEKYETVEFVRTCLKASYPFCLYCNHARRIAVNGESLVLHLIAQHRFSATVDSITAEELQPETIVVRLKSFLPELADAFFNTSSYCTIGAGAFTRHFNERIFECFQCRFVTATHKELYLHNRKMHLRTAILCFMCRCNFFSFSEILCHICPGVPHRASIFEIKFRCCLCDLDNIPSPFRLMVHLRKRHFACDICLEDCRDQSKLSSHVWKHKLHHLCYRCGIAYRNKMDITKHLFWKHGTESAICKRCLNKRWPHVYHFCVPPSSFICDVCQHCFTKAMYLTVHKRIHVGDFRYQCTEQDCEEKFISRKLLLKHSVLHRDLESSDSKDDTKISDTTADGNDVSTKQFSEKEIKIPMTTNSSEDIKNQLEEEGSHQVKTEQELKKELEPSVESKITEDEKTKCLETKTEGELPKPPTQKKKKKKRSKESLEDLNLTAPNLSESGSSSDSESETKSKFDEDEPKVTQSPQYDDTDVKEQKMSEMEENQNNKNVLDIWKNFMQAQQANSTESELTNHEENESDDILPPKSIHVCYSDHDYCKMFYPASLKSNQNLKSKGRSKNKSIESNKKRTQSMQNANSQNSQASSSSSDESSDTSSSSSCSCGSNCSCSGGSSSSSSSSSSANSESSNTSRVKRQRKKSERSSRHKKSESISPRKNRIIMDIDETMETNEQKSLENFQEPTQSADLEKSDSLMETFVNESDLETAESETDEEYYDEHPQKLASELLSQKRAQLMARTFLSPSHNFDIVENSRPSTPSLPEDVVFEKRKKKKKRERKSSSSKSNMFAPKLQLNQSLANNSQLESNFQGNDRVHSQFLTYGDNSADGATSTSLMEFPRSQQQHILQHGTPRISEGSSCSDIDGSLKRSKRARRPNKFYGYTSDDESMGSSNLGQSLLIGMRTFKPQPPPQLIWNKEDLPTPSKSILNIKKIPRAQKRPETDPFTGLSNTDNEMGGYPSLPKKKKGTLSLQGLYRKRSKNLPPIPRLKIRSSILGIGNSSKEDEYGFNKSDESSEISSDEGHKQTWNELINPHKTQNEHYHISEVSQISQPTKTDLQTIAAPPPLPLPPTPQTTVFNHKIPPALLPNPNFATLQYFKANNIRYPIRPPAGARAAREGESVYCYCRCPYDEVSEMIACDGDNCLIEWFHFECVGIMVAPQGKWFCAECRPHYSEDLYPQSVASNLMANKRES